MTKVSIHVEGQCVDEAAEVAVGEGEQAELDGLNTELKAPQAQVAKLTS